MIFKKDETEDGQPSLAEAIDQYRVAAGDLFIKPAKKLCRFEKSTHILFDRDNNLIAIVSKSHGVVHHDNLRCALRQVALSHVK